MVSLHSSFYHPFTATFIYLGLLPFHLSLFFSFWFFMILYFLEAVSSCIRQWTQKKFACILLLFWQSRALSVVCFSVGLQSHMCFSFILLCFFMDPHAAFVLLICFFCFAFLKKKLQYSWHPILRELQGYNTLSGQVCMLRCSPMCIPYLLPHDAVTESLTMFLMHILSLWLIHCMTGSLELLLWPPSLPATTSLVPALMGLLVCFSDLLIFSWTNMIWCLSISRRHIACILIGVMVPCPSQPIAEARLWKHRSWSTSLMKTDSSLGHQWRWYLPLAPIIGFGEKIDFTDTAPSLPDLWWGRRKVKCQWPSQKKKNGTDNSICGLTTHRGPGIMTVRLQTFSKWELPSLSVFQECHESLCLCYWHVASLLFIILGCKLPQR